MTFTVGGTDVAAVYLGSTPVDAVYLGDEKVWPTGPPAPPTYTFRHSSQNPPGILSNAYNLTWIPLVDANGVDRTSWLLSIPVGEVITIQDASGVATLTFTVHEVVDDPRHAPAGA